MAIEQLSWISGTWRGPAFGGMMEEVYGSPDGGCILGTSKVVVDGETIHKEFIALEMRDGRLVYEVVLPDKTHVFLATGASDGRVVWSDPANPWPREIVYARSNKVLTVTLSGTSKNGEPRTERIEMDLCL